MEEKEEGFVARIRSISQVSFFGVICSTFWLLVLITIDVHPFRFRIEAVHRRNSSLPRSAVIFPLIMVIFNGHTFNFLSQIREKITFRRT